MFIHNARVNSPFFHVSAALFDLDGTLVKTAIDFAWMKSEVITLASEYHLSTSDLQKLDILSAVMEGQQRLILLHGVTTGNEFRKRCFDRLQHIETLQCSDPVYIPGAVEILDDLHQKNVPVGIVTRNCRSVALNLLEYSGVKYDILVSRDDCQTAKPDPEQLILALSLMGVKSTDFSRAIMVGDHPMDIEAGRRLGCKTLAVLHSYDRAFFDSVMPDLIFDDLEQIVRLLGGVAIC